MSFSCIHRGTDVTTVRTIAGSLERESGGNERETILGSQRQRHGIIGIG